MKIRAAKLFLLFFILLTAFISYFTYKKVSRVGFPEYMLYSIIIVENSSGVIVYQDDNVALVLTAAHVINNKASKPPYIVSVLSYDSAGNFDLVPYEVEDYSIDNKSDLAILQIPSLHYDVVPAEIVSPSEDPNVGDDIYIASNPNFHYRSLKKGIISAKNRKTSFGDNKNWEVDAMIIFGSSGGGAFSSDGKLFGIVSGINALKTDHCWGIIDLEHEANSNFQCLNIPLPHIGYIVSPKNIRNFILGSKFSHYFNIQRED